MNEKSWLSSALLTSAGSWHRHGFSVWLAIAACCVLLSPALAMGPADKSWVETRLPLAPGATDVLLEGPALLLDCPRAKLHPASPPSRGTVAKLPRGRLLYQPNAAFWSLGGDTFSVAVRACRGVRTMRVRISASAVEQAGGIGFGAGSPPWGLTDPGRRIQVSEPETFAGSELTLSILPGTTPATVDISRPSTADDGQSNGGSLVAKIDIDDDGDPIEPPDPDLVPRVVLWRSFAEGNRSVGQLTLEGRSLTLEIEGDQGERVSCSAPYRAGTRELAIDWWLAAADGGARLRVDGVAVCVARGVANEAGTIIEHRLGDVEGTAFFPMELNSVTLAEGPLEPRRTIASAGDFGDLESWTGVPEEGWSVIGPVFARTWASIDPGTIFSSALGARTNLPWVVELAVDPASFTSSSPEAIWRLTDGRGGQRLALELRRSSSFAELRLTGLDPQGGAVVSAWQTLPAGASRLAIQGRPGGDVDRSRLWIEDQIAIELTGIDFGVLAEQLYGVPGESAAGALELGPLDSWVDRP